MRSSPFTLLGVVAGLSLVAGCAPEAIAPPDRERGASSTEILTSFDRLTLSRGEYSSFQASVVGAEPRLSSAGLTFASRAPAVAAVNAANGRATVQAIGAGRTWVVVQRAAAADSVEVVVER